jgi:membrane peptidoglycan carboxypeptidase
MGHGTYGVASAADFYFHKTVEELTLAESALLAGIIQVPGRHSPINHPEQSVRRRNLILSRMYNGNQISAAQFDEARKERLVVEGKNYDQGPAPFFTEWVRQYLEKNYSTKQIWDSDHFGSHSGSARGSDGNRQPIRSHQGHGWGV